MLDGSRRSVRQRHRAGDRARPRPGGRRAGADRRPAANALALARASTSPTRRSGRPPRSIRRVPREPLSDPRPRAVAVVERDGKVLVIRRHLDGRDYAVLPGGGIEDGEAPADAALRELREECTLDGRVAELLLEGDHGGRTAFYYRVTGVEGEPVLGGEEAEGQDETNQHHPMWASPKDLELMGLLPDGLTGLVVRTGCGRSGCERSRRPRTGRSWSSCGSRTATTCRSSGARRRDPTARSSAATSTSYAPTIPTPSSTSPCWVTGPSASRSCAG